MINEVAEYLSGCPYLNGEKVNVNYLKKESSSASLEMTRGRNAVRGYVDGGSLRGVGFVFALRGNLTEGDSETVAERCHLIERWIEEQNLGGVLPVLKSGENVISIGVLKCFEPVRIYNSYVRYEAEVEVVYYS